VVFVRNVVFAGLLGLAFGSAVAQDAREVAHRSITSPEKPSAPSPKKTRRASVSCTAVELGARCDQDGSVAPNCCAERPKREPKRRLRLA
jgi:hypothetical protein